MTKYFCGHEEFCAKNSSRALIKAKQNLQSQFAIVGVLERMDTTMRVLAAILPRYFGSLGGVPVPLVNKNEQFMTITSNVRDIILKANELDSELYEFAYNLLQEKAICAV